MSSLVPLKFPSLSTFFGRDPQSNPSKNLKNHFVDGVFFWNLTHLRPPMRSLRCKFSRVERFPDWPPELWVWFWVSNRNLIPCRDPDVCVYAFSMKTFRHFGICRAFLSCPFYSSFPFYVFCVKMRTKKRLRYCLKSSNLPVNDEKFILDWWKNKLFLKVPEGECWLTSTSARL